MYTELQASIFVRVTQLLHRHFLGYVSWVSGVVIVWALVNLNKLIDATTTAVDPHVNWQHFWTHTHAASLHIVHISPRHLKIGFFVRFLNSFRPDYNLASKIFMTTSLKVLS